MSGRPHPAQQVRMHLQARCYDCCRYHEIQTVAAHLLARLSDWHTKHYGHRIEFRSRHRSVPRGLNDAGFQAHNTTPWYLAWAANADIKLAYAASANYTITLASLASSAGLTGGRESTAVSNTSNLYLDYGIGGVITVGTTPTTGTFIEVWAYGARNDTPDYPDVFDGTDSDETVTSAAIKRGGLIPLVTLEVDSTTSDRAYPWYPRSLEIASGGYLPAAHGVFVTHNTGVNLNSTAGNHEISYTGVYRTA